MAATVKVDIPAGPLWSDDDANEKGPRIAAAHGGVFTGQWRTVIEGEMSVVEVERPGEMTGGYGAGFKCMVPAGPLWSNEDAQALGPNIAASYGGTFTGQWYTNVEGAMSLLEVEFS